MPHPASEQVLRYFKYDHLPEHLKPVSKRRAELADEMIKILPEVPEVTVGLRKLLEAKDCFVRSLVS